MAIANAGARSTYVARLRRAFLLRAHPDRFRLQSQEIRKQQATLIQAISNRFATPDFLSYTYGKSVHRSPIILQSPTLTYVLEQKDGSHVNHQLDLNGSVESILQSMNNALTLSGHASLGTPPTAPTVQFAQQSPADSITWVSKDASNKTSIDHSFDIHSNHGRDLRLFLATLDVNVIQRRNQDRLHVTAVASVVRRDYQFSAVDGTGLGWSSNSFAVLLRSLADLYHEHGHKFLVSSFYPIRLIWSSEDFTHALDIYGGILYLNPASTPTQLLQHLLAVTPESIELHHQLRADLLKASRQAQTHLGVTFRKGHSCSSRNYHELLLRLATFLPPPTEEEGLALERIFCVVESPQAARRATLTAQATIQVGAAMTQESICLGIQRLLPKARQRLEADKLDRQALKEIVDSAKRNLGLQRIHYSKAIQRHHVMDALQRLVQSDVSPNLLAGNALGVVPTGRRCHVDDDGSIMIPWDWK